jgi:branched-chain amino acid transport system permease protein
MTAFGLSGLYAGVGGGLFAYTEAFMSPDSFDVIKSITMLVAIVLGGLASIPGTVFGALFMAFQNEIVDAVSGLIPSIGFLEGYLPTTESDFERLRGAAYSIPLIIFIIFAPGGVAGLVRRVSGTAPTWWQEGRLRVTGWATIVSLALARRRAGPDGGDTDEEPGDRDEDRRP